jgi:hypothetical protein
MGNTNMLIKREGGHLRAYPLTSLRVKNHIGSGALVYATDDGWLGVQLDGETRIDEYPVAVCRSVDGAADLAELIAAVAPAPTTRQAIPVILCAVSL